MELHSARRLSARALRKTRPNPHDDDFGVLVAGRDMEKGHTRIIIEYACACKRRQVIYLAGSELAYRPRQSVRAVLKAWARDDAGALAGYALPPYPPHSSSAA